MNNIDMHLNNGPYSLIDHGIKDVEYRLNDEKRQKLNVGDTITFYNRSEESLVIKATITELNYYKTLREMITDTFDRYLDQFYESPEEAMEDMGYYKDEEIKKYGCVAISFKNNL